MTREDVKALVRLGAPISVSQLREVREAPGVECIEFTSVWAADGRTVMLDAVHFSPQTYPDAVTNPIDAPTVDGTTVSGDTDARL